MKKTLLSLLAILAFSFATLAQTWNTVNSNLPTGDGVGQISVGMNNHNALWAFACDNTGAIIDKFTKSTDGGLTWTLGSFNAGTGLSQLFAITEDTCYALFNTGASQGIYITTNGGTTWAKQGTAYGSASFADAMCFLNNHDGVAIGDPNGGYFEIYTTSDKGTTWTRIPTGNIPAPLTGEYGITGDYSCNGHFVWFGTNKGRIFRSVDKGIHWTAVLTPFGTSQTIQPAFADSLHGMAFRSFLNVGLGDSLNVTTDGGVTFQGLAVTGSMYGRYITYIPGSANTYVGSSGLAGTDQGISFSPDGGHNWYVITAGGDFQASAWLNIATGWCGSTAAAKKSTGGMMIYAGDSLQIQAPVAKFMTPDTLLALGGSATFVNQSTGAPTSYTWTFQGGVPATSNLATPPAVTYNSQGRKNVTLYVSNSFGNNTLTKTGYIYVGGVGINELNENAVSIFPNPAKDVLTVKANSNIKEIQIFNATGQMVINQKVNAKTITINTTSLSTGLYSMKAVLINGTINKKVVIQ
jgi:PKD repeat protein